MTSGAPVRDRVRSAVAGYSPQETPLDAQREAAVLLLLHELDGVEHLLFQVRSSTVRHHSGQISLPGGARSAGDATLLDTALREVEEEIGVSRDHIEIFGRMDDSYARSSNYRIRPYVGAIERGPRLFALDPREVDQLIEVPLPYLLSAESHGWHASDDDGNLEAAPAYIFGEHVIWGATWRILRQFLEVIEARP